MNTVSIHPLPLQAGTFDETARLLLEKATDYSGNACIVTHINARNYYFLLKDEALIERLTKRAVCLLDGVGMKFGVWLAGGGLHPDLNGTDLFPIVMKMASDKRLRVFLLGGRELISSKAAKIIVHRYPGIEVCEYRNGYFSECEEDEIVRGIHFSKPHILLVGMGFPRQEAFSLTYGERTGANLIWNVGGLFDFVSGIKPRAPLIVRRLRLEWLFRWFMEPRRLFLRTFFYAPAAVIKLVLSNWRTDF